MNEETKNEETKNEEISDNTDIENKNVELEEKYNKLKEEDKKMILSMIERIAND